MYKYILVIFLFITSSIAGQTGSYISPVKLANLNNDDTDIRFLGLIIVLLIIGKDLLISINIEYIILVYVKIRYTLSIDINRNRKMGKKGLQLNPIIAMLREADVMIGKGMTTPWRQVRKKLF